MLIEPEELQRRLHEPGLRILDVRAPAEYASSHIPGAVSVDVKAWQVLGSQEGGFHDTSAWAEKVSGLGIALDTTVVVYGSSLPDTARIWWTLQYVGVPKVAILDGGWALWTKQQRPTDTTPTKAAAVPFTPRFQADRLEEIGTLHKAVRAGQVTVVDARSQDEFTGTQVVGTRGGHIPGARHLEWKELLTADGRFKSRAELQRLFRQRGIEPDQTAVTC